MEKLTVRIENTQDRRKVILAGDFDRECALPEIESTVKHLTINLNDLKTINSIGILVWHRWIKILPKDIPIEIEQAPVPFVQMLNIVKGSLLPNMIVRSFYVALYSQVSGESRKQILNFQSEYNEKGDVQLPKYLDSLGNPMELDVLPGYFRFLKY